MPNWKTPFKKITLGTGRRVANGNDIAILSIGHIGNYVTKAIEKLKQEGISAAHYDMRFVKPIDEVLLHEVFGKFNKVITIEDGCLMGGMGSAVLEFMAANGYHAQVKMMGLPDKYIEHGSQIELHTECGIHPEGVVLTAKEMVEGEINKQVSA